jgi:hypothetical protein
VEFAVAIDGTLGNGVPLFTFGQEVVDRSLLLLAGDFDADGDIDGRDFLVWQRGFSEEFDNLDLLHWQANLGQSSSLSADVQSIPEPATLSWALLVVMLGGLHVRQGRINFLRFN